MFTQSPAFRQLAVVIAVNLNVLSTGVGLSWTSPALVMLSNLTQTPLNDVISDEEKSWILSVGGAAGIPGALLSGLIASAIGRKYTILVASLPKLSCWILVSVATDVRMIYAAKMLQGFSDSITFSVVSLYASEVAAKEIRGSLGTVLQVMCTLGVVTTLCVGPFITYLPLGLLCATIVLTCSLPMLVLPESPCYDYSTGKKDRARQNLKILRGSDLLATEAIKEFEVNEGIEKPKLVEIVKSRATVRALLSVLVLGLGVQATGFNAVTFSLQTVLESTGTELRPELASVAIGAAQLLACVLTAFVTDKLGRKTILVSTLVVMCFGLASLGAFFKLTELQYPMKGVVQFLPLVSLLLVVCAFSGGLGSLLWPLMAELFSDETRSFGVSVGVTSATVSSFLSTRFFFPLTAWLGHAGTYWLFSGNCLLLAIFIVLCIPETRGKTFAEIQRALVDE